MWSVALCRPNIYGWTSCVVRSIIFTNGTEESRLAALSKEREQTKSKSSVVTTQIQHLETFYPAEPEHQVKYFGTASSLLESVHIRKSNPPQSC